MIGILCACKAEFAPYKAALGGSTRLFRGIEVISGELCGHDVTALFCGIGKVNAAIGAEILIRDFAAERVIMSGTAGAIANGLHIGQCVMISDCCCHDLDAALLTGYHPSVIDPLIRCDDKLIRLSEDRGILCGRTVTGDVFVADEGRADIIERFSPLCCDMETVAAAQMCRVLDVPFNALRCISDTEDESGLGSFEKNVAFASQNAFNAVAELIKEL